MNSTADITHRAIRGKVIIERTPAMIAAEAHLQRLQGLMMGQAMRAADDEMAMIIILAGMI